MVTLSVDSEISSQISLALFGGNFLFTRDRLGDQGTFDELSEALGVENIRYPGGAIAERIFDISVPNRSVSFDDQSGSNVEIVPLDEFLSFAEESGHSVTIVLPTVTFLSANTDENGNRFADFDEALLAQFAIDVASGVYGNVEIQAFEIGNEYWGSGEMSAVEYGRLSSQMVEVLDDALGTVSNAQFPTDQIDLVVQAGTNFGYSQLSNQYSMLAGPDEVLQALADDYNLGTDVDFKFGSGALNWTAINNELIMREFDTQAEIDGLDGVAAHVYSREPVVPGSREFFLNQLDDSWLEDFPDLKTYITEWNLKSGVGSLGENDYGLKQAHEMLNIVEAFSEHNVDAAHVWPLSQNTSNALSRGFEFDELSPPGEMFRLMAEELPATRPLDLSSSDNQETELSLPDVDVHAFGSPDKFVLYLASTSDEISNSSVDLNSLLSDEDTTFVTYLGVEPGDAPGGVRSNAVIEEVSASDVRDEIFVDGVLEVELDAREIMQVVIENPTWSEEMETYWVNVGEADADTDDGPVIPVTDPQPGEDPDNPAVGEAANDDGLDMSALLFGLLPLLFVLGGV